MFGVLILCLIIGIFIGNYGGNPTGAFKFMCKWLAAKFIHDLAGMIVQSIYERYTGYARSWLGY